MQTKFSEAELDFIHCVANLKLHLNELAKMFGQDFVRSMVMDQNVQAEIARRKRYQAEEMFLKRQIDINTILELRPKALAIIQTVLDDKNHPDRTKVALKILDGEFNMIASAGKALGEKLADANKDADKEIKIVYARKDDSAS